MSQPLLYNLEDCSQFKQTLLMRPPAVVHGTALLLVFLTGCAVGWAALVRANLVVQAAGRVRCSTPPARVFTPSLANVDRCVAEVHFEEGESVSKGQVLVKLDSTRIDNRISRLRRKITAAEWELAELGRLEDLLAAQHQSQQEKARAELEQMTSRIRLREGERISQIRQATAKLDVATDRLKRYQTLFTKRGVTEVQLIEAEAEARHAGEELAQASLPIDNGTLDVLRRNLELTGHDYAVRCSELRTKKITKQGELEAAAKELANLELDLQQTVLRAPVDGVVISPSIKVGELLEPGKGVVEIAEQEELLFEVAIPSGEAGELSVGMSARVRLDTYDYQKYGSLSGIVCFIAPDSRVVEEVGGERQMAAYRVQIRMSSEVVGRGQHRGKVKLGLAGQAEIVTGGESVLSILVKSIRHTISLS